jgi:hypothetical protein
MERSNLDHKVHQERQQEQQQQQQKKKKKEKKEKKEKKKKKKKKKKKQKQHAGETPAGREGKMPSPRNNAGRRWTRSDGPRKRERCQFNSQTIATAAEKRLCTWPIVSVIRPSLALESVLLPPS